MKTFWIAVLIASAAAGAEPNWVPAWTASAHGPYPMGNAVAQPELRGILAASGADDQTFRLIVKPDIWGNSIRLRLSNAFGSQPVTFDEVYAGLHASAGSLVAGTNRPVRFNNGKISVTVEPGKWAYSDAVTLNYGNRDLSGRKMAVSFHIAGSSGPMTWHAKAMTTSYLSPPHSGAHGKEESSQAFPFTSTSWYFLDAVQVNATAGTRAIVAFGDSITDGTNSTINGDDRWPDFFSQRLHEKYGAKFAVVNEGIGGNQVLKTGGGPAALARMDQDVLSLPGVITVIWLEGVNDIGAGATAEAIIAGFRDGVSRLHARGIRVIGATITSSLNSTPTQGTPEADAKRNTVNEFIRNGGVFDGVADFDAATLDPKQGTLKPEFQPNSSIGGPGDRLHPNRAGYQAMANSIDLANVIEH